MGEDEHIRQFQILMGYSTTPASLGIANNTVWIKASDISAITDISGMGGGAALLFTSYGASFAITGMEITELVQWWKENAMVGLVTPA